MLDGYNRTTNMVFEVLQDPRIRRPNFSVANYKFEPHHYARLYFELLRGNVTAEFDPKEKETAGYNPLNDTLYFGFENLEFLDYKAAIVH